MSVYLLYGNEPYLINNRLQEIINETFKNNEEMKEYNIDILTYDDVFTKYIEALETLPFMSKKRMVIFKGCELFKQKAGKKEEEISQYIEDFIKNKVEDTVIVIVEGEKIDKKKSLFKTISNFGEVFEGNQLKPFELKNWIGEKFKKENKKISPKLIEYLGNNLPNDLYLVENEINKLLSYVGEKNSIEIEDLVICSFTVMENIFKLIDQIIYRDLGAALSTLKAMLQDGEPPMIILFMIIKQIRNIAKVKSLTSKGYTTKQIGEMIGVTNSYALAQLVKQSNEFTVSSIKKSLEIVADYEIKIKTGALDYNIGLELLISNLNFIDRY
ncbi:DNA polymerase III subunit delta [Anaerobranca gottschalkii]|uniref:DNA polymerase III subunit delta n=1 Tax=Anaerobranca gottschalkii DSM 13577 TaxID=1120990 RepID=A0A1H9YBX3_9FIRM|nr:DNA polymerase III subunit delta [Anaerobranca gottschalkii]SES66447.1 DNA polymerase III, delta subunit [Anaerobranca gottschalkii DSM 13577]